ncbi:MAG: thioredoxin [Gammaproteobacteria bacterium]|nr:thioredoxin [Gammaproteobacteria bacterium]
MQEQAQNIIDSNLINFDTDVIDASNSQLVMVDFWAEWCGPCRSLGPILEQLVEDYGGSVKLVKIDADDQQNLCREYGVQSLPTVYFFSNGSVVEQFMGLQTEQDIRTLIDKHVVSDVDPVYQQAIAEYQNGNHDGAISILVQLIETEPDNDKPKQLLAGWLTTAERWEEAHTVVESLSDESKATPEYRAFTARLAFSESASGSLSNEDLIEAIRRDENDLDSRCQLADQLVVQQHYAEAMDQLIEVIKRDRGFKDDIARQSMIKVFHVLGGRGELVSKYRQLLARTLN